MKTAAGIIIGDEILSGKVQDTNGVLLIALLRDVGVPLKRLVTLGDDPARIAEEVRYCAARFDYVFSSGGLGPTHDDCTMEAMACAFERPLVRHPQLEQIVRTHWGERVNQAALKLADLPAGARLLFSEDGLLPVVVCQNVYILPGIPQLFSSKLRSLAEELVGARRYLQSLYLCSDESSIAHLLNEAVRQSPGVTIGSYPQVDDPIHRLRITIESLEQAAVQDAVERLLKLLPPSKVLRVEQQA
jgi:molybdenum cofactor synthesis domain-containing protein